jgi:hypothetical protein
MRRPSGSSPSKNFAAKLALTIATGDAPGPSAAVKSRPRRSRRPNVSKKPGAAATRRVSG